MTKMYVNKYHELACTVDIRKLPCISYMTTEEYNQLSTQPLPSAGNVSCYTGKNIGFINIKHFQADDVYKEVLRYVATTITNDSLDGYVLDLRDNWGGYIREAVNTASIFLDKGTTVFQDPVIEVKLKEQFKLCEPEVNRLMKKYQNEYRTVTDYEDLTNGKPLVLLINQDTGSAAEIVTAALQENRRAVVIGERSTGKGTKVTLNHVAVGSNGCGVHIIAPWFTPFGNSVHKVGIEPDYIRICEEVKIPLAIDLIKQFQEV